MTTRTVELHRTDPYDRRFDARVTVVDGNRVELDSTLFYARSGGQPGDTGTLNGLPVLDVHYDEGKQRVFHLMDDADAAGLSPGVPVTGDIDWERRYRLMRHHTAQHLLWCAFVSAYGTGHRELGGDIGEAKARLDIGLAEGAPRPDADRVAAELTRLVTLDLPIRRYPGEAGEDQWVWEIDGYDPIPCGGTHLRTTGEVGRAATRVKRKGSGVFRLEVSVVT
ncbi:alanyl-tRNA editing protein [Nonomuraea sp. NPDC050404]|uniref:alanyl-tRNA editing protein n=1 Tax=Nonomuraea sp. NPDC050404 TaxID=3155783 RepID=UPI0033FFDD6D